MLSKVITIQQCIKEIHPDKLYQVKILKGAPDALVSCRELRGHYCTKPGQKGYETNREIKIWSVFFLLKAMTTAPFITNWRKQRPLLFTWLQMDEKTFYSFLTQLKKKNLITVDRMFNIHLASWEQAAHILDCFDSSLLTIPFNPYKHEGKQVFQHFLRSEEILSNQTLQHDTLMDKLDKNSSLRDDLLLLMSRQGADRQRLSEDRVYYRERLLQLQLRLFKEGSDLLDYSFTFRADINRGVKKIKEHHKYKSAQSVSYMKRRLAKHGIITIKKVKIVSEARARIYIPHEEKENSFRDGYKWFKDQKQTALILSDQITLNYERPKRMQREPVKRAA